MITETMHTITGRIVTDDDFRQGFFTQNAQILNDYDLTDHERAVLSELSTCLLTRLALNTLAMRYRQISSSVSHAAQT